MDDQKGKPPNPPDPGKPEDSKGSQSTPEPTSENEGERPAKAVPKEATAGKPGKPSDPDAARPTAKAPEKPADKPAPKPAPAKPAARKPVQRGPAYEDLEDDPLLADLKQHFPGTEITGQAFLGQPIYTVGGDVLYDVMLLLRDKPEWNFDYLVDLTALDYLPETPRFCLVYHLYSYPEGPLIRVKARISEGEYAPSVTSIWATADWLEREVFDMFGIEFSGHPDLRRILLPEDWHGFPLRKDYDIKLQDQAWIRKHLRIRKVPS